MSAESSYNKSYQVKERISETFQSPLQSCGGDQQTRKYYFPHLLHVGSSHQLCSKEKVLSVCLLQIKE